MRAWPRLHGCGHLPPCDEQGVAYKKVATRINAEGAKELYVVGPEEKVLRILRKKV